MRRYCRVGLESEEMRARALESSVNVSAGDALFVWNNEAQEVREEHRIKSFPKKRRAHSHKLPL